MSSIEINDMHLRFLNQIGLLMGLFCVFMIKKAKILLRGSHSSILQLGLKNNVSHSQ